MSISVKLSVELVPKTCWFSNVRDHVDKNTWDALRSQAYRKAGHRCEVCGGRGSRWPVECHEIFEYDDQAHIQTLIGLVALCPNCHEIKHIGLANIRGRGREAREHLAKINGWTPEQTRDYLRDVAARWRERSKHHWQLDLTFLDQFGVKIESKR